MLAIIIIEEINTLNTCGLSKPAEELDCFSYTTEINSCCFYTFFGKTGCVLYNGLHSGKAVYGGLTVSCNHSERLRDISRIILILVLLI
jgi:hypothetical protein